MPEQLDPIEEEYEEPIDEGDGEHIDSEFELTKQHRERVTRQVKADRAKKRAAVKADSDSRKPGATTTMPVIPIKTVGKTSKKLSQHALEHETCSRKALFDLAASIQALDIDTEAKIEKLFEGTKFIRMVELLDIGLHTGGNIGARALERINWMEDGKPPQQKPRESEDDMPGVYDDIGVEAFNTPVTEKSADIS